MNGGRQERRHQSWQDTGQGAGVRKGSCRWAVFHRVVQGPGEEGLDKDGLVSRDMTQDVAC